MTTALDADCRAAVAPSRMPLPSVPMPAIPTTAPSTGTTRITEAELDFLAAGETVTVVYTITVDDGNGGTDTQDVTIAITGANDAPVIAVVDVAGSITEGTTLTDTGSITFTDLDLTDTPTATEVTKSVTTALTLTAAQQSAPSRTPSPSVRLPATPTTAPSTGTTPSPRPSWTSWPRARRSRWSTPSRSMTPTAAPIPRM